jgi:predicted DNA-binding transcriptional regulator AlpA
MNAHDNEKATAAYMGVSCATLRKRRLLGQPPPFIRIGRKIVYRRSDINQFLAERTVEPNSAQQRADDTSDQPREGAV